MVDYSQFLAYREIIPVLQCQKGLKPFDVFDIPFGDSAIFQVRFLTFHAS